jgi:hypothetical protein
VSIIPSLVRLLEDGHSNARSATFGTINVVDEHG